MKQSRRPWTREEDNAVKKVVNEIGLKNWPLVSTLIRQKYNIEGRSGKQCRERWHNQLNPEVNKMPWTEQEQKLLFQAHKTYRNRWIDISKLFAGRTDNSIKNHFYSTIRRSLRRICKLLGNKNSTSELRNIKPSILSKIFEYSELTEQEITKQNSHMVEQSKIITEELLNFARSKPSKSLQVAYEAKIKNLQSLIQKLNEFSENYSNQKSGFRSNQSTKDLVKKELKPIILKSNEKASQMFNQSQEQSLQVPKKTHRKSKKQQKDNEKEYKYDWQQFQRRCLFVKKMIESQTDLKSSDEISIQCEIQQKQKQIIEHYHSLTFFEKQGFNLKEENFITPKTKRNFGFLPYKTEDDRTVLMKEEFETTIDKLKADYVQSSPQ